MLRDKEGDAHTITPPFMNAFFKVNKKNNVFKNSMVKL